MANLTTIKLKSATKFALLGGLAIAALLALQVSCASNSTAPAPAGSASSRSILAAIPGVRTLASWTDSLVETLGGALERGVGAFNGELRAASRNNADARALDECLDDVQCFAGAERDLDAKRNVSEIINSRGFRAEEHEVTTRDGYILTVQRIINPLVAPDQRAKLKPVILQHGLMSSSVDWVINSFDVRPARYPAAPAPSDSEEDGELLNSIEAHQRAAEAAPSHVNRLPVAGPTTPTPSSSPTDDSQAHPNALGFYLANRGYDVWLANSRGNIYGQRHAHLSAWTPKFWDFTFDEQIKFDLPDTIAYVQRLTNHTKLGYVGHSQGTTMMLGLLADQPEFAEVVAPVVLLAPVAYVAHCLSPVRHFAALTPLFQHVNMWFASSNAAVRYLGPIVCGPQVIRRELCANIIFLSTGFDEAEFNMTRVSAYLAHMPSGTSVKNVAHWGQMVNSGRFAHFDHGLLANQLAYANSRPPAYELAKIRSPAISLFTAENDWLASPLDVAKLRAELQVPLFRWVNVTEDKPKWNHIDFVYAKDAGRLVNKKIIDIFAHFD